MLSSIFDLSLFLQNLIYQGVWYKIGTHWILQNYFLLLGLRTRRYLLISARNGWLWSTDCCWASIMANTLNIPLKIRSTVPLALSTTHTRPKLSVTARYSLFGDRMIQRPSRLASAMENLQKWGYLRWLTYFRNAMSLLTGYLAAFQNPEQGIFKVFQGHFPFFSRMFCLFLRSNLTRLLKLRISFR